MNSATSRNKLEQRCNVAGSIVALFFCVLLGYFSYLAVIGIHDSWHAVDYWLAWFSGFSMLGSVGSAVSFSVYVNMALRCVPSQNGMN